MDNFTSKYEFTIVVPLYNEEDNIERLKNELSSFLPTSFFSTCVLFVDDGSTDNSLQKVKEACSMTPNFYYISFAKNRGLSAAIKAGIDIVQSKYIGYIDADLQTTPKDFNLLLPHLKDYKMAIGIRMNRKDTFIKKLSSKIANNFRRYMTKDDAIDTGCPLKVLHTEYARRMPFFTGMHRFMPALLLLEGESTKQVVVSHFPRIAGVAKYNLRNRLISPLVDCFGYRWMKKRYIRYTINDNNL
ncbi:MAG: glycosyltransferase [Rikenellaceae bacterium]